MNITTLRTLLYALAYFVLFGAWGVIVGMQVPGAETLVGYIHDTLIALTGHVLTMLNPIARPSAGDSATPFAPPPVLNQQSGSAMPSFLMLLAAASFLLLSACVTVPQSANQTQAVQAQYVQACSTYGAAFETALQLRLQGRLNQSQIDQVTLIDQQITPICTGPLPADLTAATQQITAAATSLAILETVKKGN